MRVRERNLRNGSVTEKDIEKYVSSLPDLAEQAEPFGTSQPALAQPPAPAVAEPMDDDDEDDDDAGDAGDAANGADADGGASDGDAGDGGAVG